MSVWHLEAVFSLHEAKKLTFDTLELEKSYLHVTWLEFHQEFNGYCPGYVTYLVCYLEDNFTL